MPAESTPEGVPSTNMRSLRPQGLLTQPVCSCIRKG